MATRRLTNEQWGFSSSCFVCEPTNGAGLRIPFEHDDETGVVRGSFTLDERFSGAPAYVHGGVTLAILDEAMAWATIALGGRFAVTSETTTRFAYGVKVGRPYTVEATLESDDGERMRTSATVLDDRGRACARAEATFTVLGAAHMAEVLGVDELSARDAAYLKDGPDRFAPAPGGEVPAMENKGEDLKGRVKEAGGNLTGDKDLEREGKADQASADIKDKASGAVDKVKDAFKK